MIELVFWFNLDINVIIAIKSPQNNYKENQVK